MKKLFRIIFLMLLFAAFSSKAQKISKNFNPIIKKAPDDLKIIQYNDNEYLVFGDIYYYQNEESSSIIKTDKNGSKISSFAKVSLNHPINSVAILPSGKILIQGNFSYCNNKPVGDLVLLNADGSVDESFSADQELKVVSFAVEPTGKILIIYVKGTGNECSVARLNTDGTMDDQYLGAPDAHLDINSKIIVSSTNQTYVSSYSKIYKLLADGGVDDSFAMPSDPYTAVNDFAVTEDNNVIVSMSTLASIFPYTVTHSLSKFFANGAKDNSFNSLIASQQIMSITIRKSGTIAITGLFQLIGETMTNAAELNADGTLKHNLITTNFNGLDYIYEDSFENLYITGGFTMANNSQKKYIVKLNPDYNIDPIFDLPVSAVGMNSPYAPISIQKDGKLLHAGDFFSGNLDSNNSKLVRFNHDGTVDSTFVAAMRKADLNTNVYGLAVQDDNKILVGGFYIFDSSLSRSFGRLLPNGAVDTTFNIGFGTSASTGGSSETVKVIKVKNEKIYVAGHFDRFNFETHQCIVVLDMNGNIVGPAQNSLPTNSYIQDIEIQSTGKIILMGTFPLANGDKSIVRLNVDGTLDGTFDLDIKGNLIDLEIDQQDNIYLGGNYLNFVTNTALLKFDPDGKPEDLVSADAFIGPSGHFAIVYNIKALPNGTLAIGGLFDKFNETTTPGIVFLDKDGKLLPFENPFDSHSFPLLSAYSDNTLYMMGKFKKDNGLKTYSCTKILFDIENIASEFKALAKSDSTILLSWNGNFEGAEGIKIERSTDNSNDFRPMEVIPVNSTSYIAKNLTEVTPYYFRISGVNEFYSSSTLEGSAVTLIKKAYTIAATDFTLNSFVARWRYEPGTDSCLVQVSKDNFKTFANGYEHLILNTDSILVEGLEKGAKYQYRVKRFKNNVASEFSNVTEVNLFVLGTEENSFTLSVYPNPSSDFIKINNIPHQYPTELKVSTLEGQLLTTVRLDKNSHTLDIRNLPPGIFIISISQPKTKIWRSYKFIKS